MSDNGPIQFGAALTANPEAHGYSSFPGRFSGTLSGAIHTELLRGSSLKVADDGTMTGYNTWPSSPYTHGSFHEAVYDSARYFYALPSDAAREWCEWTQRMGV